MKEMESDRRLSGAELVNPYTDASGKGEQVEQMFDSIAPAYDFMNTAMTFGLHRWWRRRALDEVGRRVKSPARILDVATGTGDVAFDLLQRYPDAEVRGVDLSEGMLAIAEEKKKRLPETDRRRMTFGAGDSLALEFGNDEFDLVTVAYGVRNFEHLRKGLSEIRRVMRPGGTLCIIELSCPSNPVALRLYNIYSRGIIPAAGRLVSGDSRAYSYLPESIAAAPQRGDMTRILAETGFADATWKSLTMGAVTYYIAKK